MKVHDIIERSVEWVAYDGVLGTEPYSLQQYLAKSDPSIDDDYFAYIFTLLVRHPSIKVSISNVPLAAQDKTVRLGDAPLPEDYEAPSAVREDVDITQMYRQGVKGRALAYHLFGQESKTSKQVAEEKRAEYDRHRLKGGKSSIFKATKKDRQNLKEVEEELIRDIKADDGGGIARSDLDGLSVRWGSRLRVRCTDDEIYFRLTGSRVKNPKITPIVFETLQHSVKSRERGITTVELGPLVGTSQGSMHHYMKTLTGLGLCAKVPAVLHAAVTNLLVFHRFLNQNDHYRAHSEGKEMWRPTFEPVAPELDSIDADDERADNDTSVPTGPATAHEWGLSFARLTESELMSGLVVKDRLLKLLEHPGLTNHLLRAKNLLPLLGWVGDHELRHRRAVPRAMRRLILDDLVEFVEAGPNKVKCLRLTKYNPDHVPRSNPTPESSASGPILHDVGDLLRQHSNTLVIRGGCTMLQSLSYQIAAVIYASGTNGILILQIRDALSGLFKRFIEFYFTRLERLTKPPPHLQRLEYSVLMESYGKERRLRAFGREAYRELLRRSGEVVDDTLHPPVPPQAGHMADISYRLYCQTSKQYWAQMDALGTPTKGVNWHAAGGVQASRPPKRPLNTADDKPSSPHGSRRDETVESAAVAASTSVFESRPKKKPQVKAPKYDIDQQIRGRPRKYIHVVQPDGKVVRNIIGQVMPHPDLEAIYIYLPDKDVLVPAPAHYSGVDPPPALTPEAMEKALPPSHFEKYDSVSRSKAKGRGTRTKVSVTPAKATTTKKPKKEVEPVIIIDDNDNVEAVETPRPKRPRTSTSKVIEPHTEGDSKAEEPVAENVQPEGARTHRTTLSAEIPVSPRSKRQPAQGDLRSFLRAPAKPAMATPSSEGGDHTSQNSAVDSAMPASTDQATSDDVTMSSPQPESAVPTIANEPPVRVSAPDYPTDPTSSPARDATQSNKLPTPTIGGDEPSTATSSGVNQTPTPMASVVTVEAALANVSHTQAESRLPTGSASPATSPPIATPAHPQSSPPPEMQARGPSDPLFFPDGEDDRKDAVDEAASTVEKANNEAITLPMYDAKIAEIRSAVPIRTAIKVRKGKRVDLGAIRREAEFLTVLQEIGGVREEHDLWKRHQEWSRRVAGTDAPSAPLVGATMDRTVWKRIIESLKEDGRICYTSASVPSSATSWSQYKIVWLADTPEERVKTYQRALANTVRVLHVPKDPMISQTLPNMSYSEVRLPSSHPSSRYYSAPTPRSIDKVSRNLTGDARRDELLKDPLALSQLYGRQTGKFVRSQILHRAIRAAIHNPKSQAVLSAEQGTFGITLLSEDLSVGAWYSIVLTHERDENLIAWLRDPENRKTRLKDLPFQVGAAGRGREARVKLRIRGHIELLTALGILSSAAFCDPQEADITIDAPHMATAHLKIIPKASTPDILRNLVLHDYAPVYHTAATPAVKLGYLPVRTDQEIEAYWEAQRVASIGLDMSRLPTLLERPPSDCQNVAHAAEVVDLDISSVTGMQQDARWRSEMRLLPIQKSALANAIDLTEGVSKLATTEDLEAFAWEYALPPDRVQEELHSRLTQARTKAEERREQYAKRAAMQRARKAKAQKALATKLAERQAHSRRQWESRVESACLRLHTEYTLDILAYVSQQGLTALTRGNLTDDKIEEFIRYYVSTRYREAVQQQQARMNAGEPPVHIPQMMSQAPKQHVVRRRLPKPSMNKREKPYRAPGTRYRRKWTPQDDEMIVDAEAIIRCRNRGVTGNRGRYAMEQIFPGCMPQTYGNRLKKTIDTPEKESYLYLLERAWYAIWTELRGTEELPDPNIESNEDFDLRKHLEVFRRKINKNSLRAQAASMTPGDTSMTVFEQAELPTDVHLLSTGHQWKYSHRQVLSFDVLWQSQSSQEHRLGQVGAISLKMPGPHGIKDVPGYTSLRRGRLRAILRMIVSTPASQYDQTVAIRLLEEYDQQTVVNPEILSMVNDKILIKHASASLTGRFYSFTHSWLSHAQGPFPGELHKAAAATSIRLAEPEGMDWHLMNTGGDVAALMSSVSDHQVDFAFDIKRFPTVAADQGVSNTKKLSDVSFEFEFSARKVPIEESNAAAPSLTEYPAPRPWLVVPTGYEIDHSKLRDVVEQSGPIGIAKPELAARLNIGQHQLAEALSQIATSTDPRVFWAGFDTARLVSTTYWQAWQCPAITLIQNEYGQVVQGGGSVIRCTPRKWVDIWGRRIDEVWNQAVECAKGWLMSRPGMTERILREKLEIVMDRLETNDVLQFLLDKGVADRRLVDEKKGGVVPPVEAVDVEEEEGIYWVVKPSKLFL